MEKSYKFQVFNEGSKKNETIEVEESKLNKEQKELLLGDIIQRFNGAPAETQMQFLTKIVGNAEKDQSEIQVVEPKIISLTPDNPK